MQDLRFSQRWLWRVPSTIFWDMTPCSPLNVNRYFGGTHRLHLQGRKNVSSTRNQRENRWQAESLFFRLWIWSRYVPTKHRLTLNGLHGVISQKMVLFKGIHIGVTEKCLIALLPVKRPWEVPVPTSAIGTAGCIILLTTQSKYLICNISTHLNMTLCSLRRIEAYKG
jgi:hypothetical protein